MATLTKTGIADNNPITPVMITELYDAFIGTKAYDNININSGSLRVRHDGKVSIGTTSTTHALNVEGTISASAIIAGTFTISSSDGFQIAGLSFAGGNVSASLGSTGSFSLVTFGNQLSGSSTTTASMGQLDVTNRLSVGGDLQLIGSITSSKDLSINGFPSVSASLAAAVSGSGLGNHTATQDLNMNNRSIKNLKNVTASGDFFLDDGDFSGSIHATMSFGRIETDGGLAVASPAKESGTDGHGQVQFRSSQSFAASSSFVFNQQTGKLFVNDGISGSLTSTSSFGRAHFPGSVIIGGPATSSRAMLEVHGSVLFTEMLQFTGSLSGSLRSTASFGDIVVANTASIANLTVTDNLFFTVGDGFNFDSDVKPTNDDSHSLGTADKRFKDVFVSRNVTGSLGSSASFSNLNIADTASIGMLNVVGDTTIGGQITFGDASTDTVIFNTGVSSSFVPDHHDVFNIGSATKQWRRIFFSNLITGSLTSTGSFGSIQLPDNGRLSIGDSQDLQIYHNGSHSFIKDGGSGNLILLASAFQVKNAANNETMLQANENGSVTLFYDNNQRLVTQAGGLSVTGNITGSGNVSGSATSTGSFGNLFVDGNISASGIVRADGFQSRTGADSIDFKDSLDLTGDITASGHISGSITSTGSFGRLEIDTLGMVNLTASFGHINTNTVSGTLTDPLQPNITSVGTLTTGSYQASIIASEFLDPDTAHLTTVQTFTGEKTFTKVITGSISGTLDQTSSLGGLDVAGAVSSSRVFTNELRAGVQDYPFAASNVFHNFNNVIGLVLKRTGESGTSDFFRAVDNQNKLLLNIDNQGGISGSLNSTASFGKIELSNNVLLNNHIISGTDTGSFHNLHVEGSASFGFVTVFDDVMQFNTDPAINTVAFTSNINSSFIPHETNLYDLGSGTNRWRDVYVSNDITGSIETTASVGRVETAGDINTEGRIFEQGTSVVDHATAMAIVFGG